MTAAALEVYVTDIIYSLQHECWNIGTGQRKNEFESNHMEVDTIIFLHTLFLYKSKLYKKNETEIGETYKQIRTF